MLTTTFFSMNNENNIVLDTLGKILEGRHKGWYILIEDDFENTGGYLICIFNDPINGTEGFDRWAENQETLNEMFKSAQWKIQWLDKPI